MRTKTTLLLAGIMALTVTFGLSLGGCLMARDLHTSYHFDLPNTLTERGFQYVKKGVEARYDVKGFWPAELDRAKVVANLSIAQNAYARMWKAAGGLKDDQRFVNVIIEASFVRVQGGFKNELWLIVHMYADVVKVEGAATAPPPPAAPPAGEASPTEHGDAGRMVGLIQRSIQAASRRLDG